MDFVVDANILFAALLKQGITAELLFRNDFHLYAPEFILEEFEDYRDLLEEKTKRSDEEFITILRILQRRIMLVPREEIGPWLPKAKLISPDVKDVTYVALALRLNCAIWSNDRALKEKQDVIKVYNTEDLLHL